MTTPTDPPIPPHVPPAQRMAELLESLPPAERLELTAWLLQRTDMTLPMALGRPVEPLTRRPAASGAGYLASMLPAGEESQLVTIRLPAASHAQLRGWCSAHEFTMAAVVRGLIERFLEQQAA